nr:hypothetical protein [Tanacetum cinerariifolium]
MNNKPYYKIIRADDTHQLYVSFVCLLRNFDRGDLEALWSLVKEKFSTTKPKNFSDDFLLVTLRAMFEKPNIHAQIWKTQRNEHVPAKDIDWDKAIDHVKRKAKEDLAVKRYQVLKRKPQTKAQARKNMIMYLKNVAGFKINYFKGMSYDDIRPIFEAKFNSNVVFLLSRSR